jgi:predicted dinucleotide-binding enzyme
MKIGIIGADDRALAIGRLLTSGGHEVTFGHPLEEQRVEQAASQVGAETEIPYRQALTRDIILFAVPHGEIDAALTALGSGVDVQAIIDATDGAPQSDGVSEAELLAKKLNSHKVVRALIVLPQAGANIPICGDDPLAKQAVEEAFAACNCVVTDRGPLANAAELEPPRTAEHGTIEGEGVRR